MATDAFEIREGGLDDARVVALLRTHLDAMHAQSPPESTHALDLSGLRDPSVAFFSAWDAETLLAVGALKRLDASHGEIKSMHTAAAARGRGVGRAMLAHIEAHGRRCGLKRLSLETGTLAAFAPARALYLASGYQECPPFSTYTEDPYSVFMTKAL